MCWANGTPCPSVRTLNARPCVESEDPPGMGASAGRGCLRASGPGTRVRGRVSSGPVGLSGPTGPAGASVGPPEPRAFAGGGGRGRAGGVRGVTCTGPLRVAFGLLPGSSGSGSRRSRARALALALAVALALGLGLGLGLGR